MDEFKNMNPNSEFPVNSAVDNKVKINFADIESTESGFASEERFGAAEEVAQTPVKAAPQPVVEQMPFQPQVAVQSENEKNNKTEKKSKNNAKLEKIFRISVIAILSVVTLWTVMYTVDHSLAAQGIAPLFSVSSEEYKVDYLSTDKAAAFSYKCLGYKIQFLTNENYQLTQDCVWAWEDGPNDILLQRGQLFPVGTAK